MTGYDSTRDTYAHAARVAELIAPLIGDLAQRAATHDRSKTLPPERAVFDEYTPRLAELVYDSPDYRAALAAMGDGLAHHYSANRHHPEHFSRGVVGMTLVDLIEMLADWRAATERGAGGDLRTSIEANRVRFGLGPILTQILTNTAAQYGWLPGPPAVDGPYETCGVAGTAPNGEALDCDQPAGHDRPERRPDHSELAVHCDGSRDSLIWKDGEPAAW